MFVVARDLNFRNSSPEAVALVMSARCSYLSDRLIAAFRLSVNVRGRDGARVSAPLHISNLISLHNVEIFSEIISYTIRRIVC